MPATSRFTNLPAPAVIETLSYETILDELKTEVLARFDAAGIAYDVDNLLTDPIIHILIVAAGREVTLRSRINDAAARANLLAFSDAADLDHQAEFYGVTRLANETDDALFERVKLAIAGRSTAGPEARYAYLARSASARVKEVAVYRVDGGPEIFVAIRSTDNGGVPDSELLDEVEAAVTASDAMVLSDIVTVGAATTQTANITANVWLLPNTPMSVFTALEDTLRDAWDAEAGIGFDLSPSWIISKLHVPGVSRVEVVTPAAPVTVDDRNAIALGTISLTYKGAVR